MALRWRACSSAPLYAAASTAGQPDALLDDPAQPVHGDQRRDGAGQQDEARDQGLPALRRRMAVARHHLPPATLPP